MYSIRHDRDVELNICLLSKMEFTSIDGHKVKVPMGFHPLFTCTKIQEGRASISFCKFDFFPKSNHPKISRSQSLPLIPLEILFFPKALRHPDDEVKCNNEQVLDKWSSS